MFAIRRIDKEYKVRLTPVPPPLRALSTSLAMSSTAAPRGRAASAFAPLSSQKSYENTKSKTFWILSCNKLINIVNNGTELYAYALLRLLLQCAQCQPQWQCQQQQHVGGRLRRSPRSLFRKRCQ